MEHLLNCHGEWAAVMAAFSSFGALKLYLTTAWSSNEKLQK